MQRRSVLFPAPLGPITATTSVGWTAREISCRTTWSWKLFDSRSSSSSGGPPGPPGIDAVSGTRCVSLTTVAAAARGSRPLEVAPPLDVADLALVDGELVPRDPRHVVHHD